MRPTIYLDNAATTPLAQTVFDAMQPYYTEQFYNPSANYYASYQLRCVIENARETIASTIGCDGEEIYFTSGGTESDNWALRYAKPNDHIITTKIEHHAVLNTCAYLETRGVEVTYLDVDQYGCVDIQDIENVIKSNTVLISVMMVNNEIGTIQDMHKIGDIAHKHNILFHTDAVQAYGHINIDVRKMNIDMLSASAHKFNGPKGIGFLYVNKDINLPQMIYGGGQQFGMRSGTENVPAIVGMSKAAEIAYMDDSIQKASEYVLNLRDYMQKRVENEIANVHINGYNKEILTRMPYYLNICFDGVRGEQLLTLLSMNGIYASTGSACNSSSGESSHVLKAIGLSDEQADSSIRFTLSVNNTKDEIDYTVDVLKRCINDIRRFS